MADKEEDPVPIDHEDGSYTYGDDNDSKITDAIKINPDVHETFQEEVKSPTRGAKTSSVDDDILLRSFELSDFKDRKSLKDVNGRCALESAILKEGDVHVILKYLRHEMPNENFDDIMGICNICSHQNVLRILGVLYEREQIALVSVCQEGDVCDWAKKQEYDHQKYSAVSIQMGEGLNHLHGYDIVHRDVALRNFLFNLHKGINVKICDFEMGKFLTYKMVHTFDRLKEKLPWQNSPVEALKWERHTKKSDVYSFGITLWELFKRGKEPFATYKRAQMVADLEKYFSAAQILNMDGIPPKMKLLIECCTRCLVDKRPEMDDVVRYLKGGGTEQYTFDSFPEYFKNVILRKKRYDNPDQLRYGELEMKKGEIDDLPPSEPLGLANPELGIFFTKLVKPKNPAQIAEVAVYVSMCVFIGMHYESDLQEYLESATFEDLKDDFFFLKPFHGRKLAKVLFKHDKRIMESVSKTMKTVTTYLGKHPEMFHMVTVRLNNDYPDTNAGETVLANNIRGDVSQAGILGRVGGMEKGSVIVKLFMTSDNAKRFKEQLQDEKSILRTGTFFRTAELIDEDMFRWEPIIPPEIDAFSFLGFLSEKQLDCATILFNYGIYNNSDLIEFLSDANIEEKLELIEFPEVARRTVMEWAEGHGIQNPEVPSNTRPEKKMQVMKRQKERDPDLYKALEPEYGYQELGNLEEKPHTVLEGPRKTLVLSFNRYNKTLQLIEECCSNGAIKRDQFNLKRPTKAYDTAKSHLENPSKEFTTPQEFENIISELNKFSADAAQFVVSRNALLKGLVQSKDVHGLHADLQTPLEAQLWWIASFGMQTRISWEGFFNALVDYMGTVCNYPLTKGHRLFKEMQLCLRSCFGTIESGEGWISMKDFKKFYQRFGPWESIFCKSLPLCDSDGHPEHYFSTTESRTEGETYLKEQNLGHIIRFSSRPGKFVYQRKGSNILIDNTPEGFKARDCCERDIPGLIFQIWQNEEEPQAQMWRVTLQHINETGSKTYYDFAPPSGGRVHGKPVEMDEEKYPADKPGDQLVTALRKLDSSKPRLFVVLPRNMPADAGGLLTETKWVLIVLCEGNHLVDRGDESHLRPHFTNHKVLDIVFPASDILNNLPYIRTGVEFLSRAIKENVIDATSHGDVIMQHLGKDKGSKSVTESLDAFQKTVSDMLENFDVPDAAEFIGQDFEDYQSLRRNVFDNWLNLDVSKGSCRNLQWSQSGNAGEHTWVCEDHIYRGMAQKSHAGKDVEVRVAEEYTFAHQLQQIINMGFVDEKKNRDALKATDGNVEQALNRLI